MNFLYSCLLAALYLVSQYFSLPSQMKNNKVEVYLPGSLDGSQTRGETQFFQPMPLTGSDRLFLSDSEIISYEIVGDTSVQNGNGLQYYLNLSESGREKLVQLDSVELCCGRRFIIAVDGRPVFGGYFWNLFSSFSCDWIVAIRAKPFDKLLLEKGYPSSQFTASQPDPRSSKELLDAFYQTGRLVRKN